jgi:hypothetical protein
MTRAGRKPMGPALVEHLEGSERAKQRLEVILETITGGMTIDQACECLGIKPAMLHRLRTEVLEAGLARLEPRPLGRPRQVPSAEQLRCEELQGQVAELKSELKIAAVREEVANLLPHLAETDDSPGKKTADPEKRKRRRKYVQRRSRQRRPAR